MTTEAGTYQLAINTWGRALQLVMALEEAAELQKEVCKILRGDYSADRMKSLASEIADVRHTLNQLEYMFELKVQCAGEYLRKLERLQKKLQDELADGQTDQGKS